VIDSKVAFAISKDPLRPILNSVYFAPNGNVVATDGFRMSVLSSGLRREEPVLVPVSAVKQFMRVGGGMEVNGGKVTVSMGSTQISAVRVDGTFPDYAQIVPGETNVSLRISKKDLLAAISELQPALEGGFSAITFRGEGNTLHMRGKSEGTIEARTSIEVNGDADGVEMGLNGQYLKEAVRASEHDIQIGYTAKNKPLIIREQGNFEWSHMIMPVQIN